LQKTLPTYFEVKSADVCGDEKAIDLASNEINSIRNIPFSCCSHLENNHYNSSNAAAFIIKIHLLTLPTKLLLG